MVQKKSLQIIETSTSRSKDSSRPTKYAKRVEKQALFERMWLLNPLAFDPMRTCMGRERVERSWNLLKNGVNPEKLRCADIGCGTGVFSEKLQENGALVEAVDISQNALNRIQSKEAGSRIPLKREAMPETTLPDASYDLLICTDLLTCLDQREYRLAFSELSRLLTTEGYLLFSTPIDFKTEGGVEKLQELAQTEFEILDAVPSYHKLYICLERVFEKIGSFFPIQSLVDRFRQSRRLLRICEKATQFLWDEAGISHYIFLGKKRRLPDLEPEQIPEERLGKKQIWN